MEEKQGWNGKEIRITYSSTSAEGHVQMSIFFALEEMRKAVGREGGFGQIIVADRPFVMAFGVTVCEIEIDRVRVISDMLHLFINK